MRCLLKKKSLLIFEEEPDLLYRFTHYVIASAACLPPAIIWLFTSRSEKAGRARRLRPSDIIDKKQLKKKVEEK